MKKLFYFIIILAVLGGGYYYWSAKDKQALLPEDILVGNNSPEDGQASSTQEEKTSVDATNGAAQGESNGANSTPTTKTQGTYSTGEEGMAPDVLVIQVSYDGSKFEPASVDLKVGDIVIFKNNSDAAFWPASGDHPTHLLYSEFDAKQAISPGGKFQFKFEKVGSWGFHDHLNEQIKGVINVSQ